MFRRVLFAALVDALVAPLAAQAPAGMKMRVDRSTDASDPDDNPELKVVTVGKGYRVTGGPAGVFWNPATTAKGDYTLRASFTLMQPSNHVNYYGLVFGGSALEGASQEYTYFVVAQNGTFQIRQMMGSKPSNVMGRTPHASIKQPDAAGTSTNVLEVRVKGDTISYAVNDQVVHTMPKGNVKTDGLVGVRINHMLDVQVEGPQVLK